MSEKKQVTLPIEQIINLPKVKELVPAIQEQLVSGEYDTLKAFIFFRKIGKLAEEIVKGENGKTIKDTLEEDIRKYQEGKTSKVHGIEIREQSRGYWTYEECNDPLWEELKKIEAQIKERIKIREKELQLQIPTPGMGISECKISVPYFPVLTLEDNTDLVVINPPYKGSRTIFAYFM